ncbi:iron ABC transporter substrate-binding protein [Jannaschia sp. R86511]|uniref:iron ABC transporter substrate-binding protein n=1 Tax=Jannaschia sp. R86511 TaxID=3093853 RepID=UPI0036D284BE
MSRPTRSAHLSRTALVTGTLLALAGLAACGDGADDATDDSASPAAAATDEVLTVYSGRTENLIQPLLDSFAEETGATVDVRYFDSADLALLIEQEGERSPADVFISQSPGALGYLNDLGVLTELEPEVLDLVSEDFQATDGRWVGMSGRVRTLVYNSDLVDESELPDSVFDLTAPEWSGRIGVPPTNGSFQDFVTALRETEGDDAAAEWLAGLVANEPVTYSNNTATLQAVAAGEVEVGLVNHYYNYRALAEDPSLPTVNHFFEAGDIGNLNIVTGVAVVETTDDAELANDFVEYMLGEEAQTFFSEETFEYPLVEGVEPGTDLPPIADLGIATFDVNSLGGGLERTQELIAESGLEG